MKPEIFLKLQNYLEKNNIKYEGISDNLDSISFKWISAEITYKQVTEIYRSLNLDLVSFCYSDDNTKLLDAIFE